jgi:hypothetical protein
LVDIRCLEHCLDTETVRSLHHQKERECLKREKQLLQSENQLLRDTIAGLEAHEGPSFEDGYFTACYEVATALPIPFDLQATLNWDQDQIMTKVAQLAEVDQEAEVPPHDAAQLDPSIGVAMGASIDGVEGIVQDPHIQKEQVVDPTPSSSAIQVEDEVDLARSEVPTAGGTQIESTAKEEDDAI